MNKFRGKLLLAALTAVILCAVPTSALSVGAHGKTVSSRREVRMRAEDPLAALALLDETKAADAASEYRLEQVSKVGYGTIYRFCQIHDGSEVFGGEVTVAVDEAGKVLSVNGNYRDLHTMPEVSLDETAAIEAVTAQLGGEVLSAKSSVFAAQGAPEPAYEIYTDADGGTHVFVSAVDGEILLSAPLSSSAALSTIQTDADGNAVETVLSYDEGSGVYTLSDELRNIYAYDSHNREFAYYEDFNRATLYSNTTGTFDSMAVSVFNNVVKAYDFYTVEENIGAQRYGLNDGNDQVYGNMSAHREIPIRLYIHYGTNFENAAFGYDDYLGAGVMYVGDGYRNGVLYRQGKALDVIGHEYQHGVTHFAAGFEYLNDSGALDEAFSDIFGALVEGHTPDEEQFWLIGENGVPQGLSALRSIRNPSDGYRATVADKIPPCNRPGDHYDHGCDNGGVHENSTIISHVQYTAWKVMPQYFTRERIGQLWYATLCALTPTATFDDFAEQFMLAADHLGFTEDAQTAIYQSLSASGLVEGEHTVRFRNYDNSLIASVTVAHGEAVVPPPDPSRPMTARYVYTFTGWDADLSRVLTDMTVTAQYARKVRNYTVTFTDDAGNVLAVREVPYGSSAIAPDPPVKPADAEYEYEFTGWSGNYKNVTDDRVCAAQYSAFPRTYAVTFTDWDGEVLKEEQVPYMGTASPPDAPTREADAQYEYTFAGWEGSTENISQDGTVTARYEAVLRRYTVTLSDRGAEHEKELRYGDRLPVPEARAGYDFTGWYLDEECLEAAAETVNGTATLYAGWALHTYTLTLYEGETPRKVTAHYGDALPVPEARKGYTFAGWYLDEAHTMSAGEGVESDQTLYAAWEKSGGGCRSAIGISGCVAALAILGGAGIVLAMKKRKS